MLGLAGKEEEEEEEENNKIEVCQLPIKIYSIIYDHLNSVINYGPILSEYIKKCKGTGFFKNPCYFLTTVNKILYFAEINRNDVQYIPLYIANSHLTYTSDDAARLFGKINEENKIEFTNNEKLKQNYYIIPLPKHKGVVNCTNIVNFIVNFINQSHN